MSIDKAFIQQMVDEAANHIAQAQQAMQDEENLESSPGFWLHLWDAMSRLQILYQDRHHDEEG